MSQPINLDVNDVIELYRNEVAEVTGRLVMEAATNRALKKRVTELEQQLSELAQATEPVPKASKK